MQNKYSVKAKWTIGIVAVVVVGAAVVFGSSQLQQGALMRRGAVQRAPYGGFNSARTFSNQPLGIRATLPPPVPLAPPPPPAPPVLLPDLQPLGVSFRPNGQYAALVDAFIFNAGPGTSNGTLLDYG